MDLKTYLQEIENFLSSYLQTSCQKGYVLGLSGGVDSTLVAALAKKAVGKEKLLCLMLPIHSNPNDLEDGLKVAKLLDVNYKIIDASDSFDALVSSFIKEDMDFDVSTKGNIKVRMRMTMLYAVAQKLGYLVLGTDNMDERYVGYFTKYGDGAADLLPIVHLNKEEVIEASRILGIPEELASRVPTAGLFEGQTDEKELQVTYKELDAYLLGKEVSSKAKDRIEYLHRISEHKRSEIPTPIKFIRD